MKRTWTIIGVANVSRSFKWYQALLCLPATVPAHDYFGQFVDADGTVLLCVHEWSAHEHPSLANPHHATPVNGLVCSSGRQLWRDFASSPRTRQPAGRRAHVNPNTGTMEFSLRDPDGYYVAISALAPASS